MRSELPVAKAAAEGGMGVGILPVSFEGEAGLDASLPAQQLLMQLHVSCLPQMLGDGHQPIAHQKDACEARSMRQFRCQISTALSIRMI